MNRLQEIETRMAALALEIEEDGADLDVLENEINELTEERKGILAQVEKRKNLIATVAGLDIPPVKTFEQEERGNVMEKQFTTASPEYRSAFFKTLAGEELNEVEKRAFTHTTANTDVAMPVETADRIWSLIEEEHSILGDITIYRTGTVFEVTKHTAIVAGDAAQVNEGVANADEQNTFVTVTLSGKDFSKHVEVSYALNKMTAGVLENYLVDEISQRIGAALAEYVVAQILTDMDAGNKALGTAGDQVTYQELVSAFGALKNASSRIVYVNNTTLFGQLVSMVDDVKRPLFQPSMQDGSQGVLLGAQIHLEDSLPDNVMLVGDPKKVVGNFVQDIMIERDRDIKRHVHVFSGYARFEATLVAPKAFAQLTIETPTP